MNKVLLNHLQWPRIDRKRICFWLSFSVAVLSHATALFFINDLKIESNYGRRAVWENQNSIDIKPSQISQKEDIKQKNDLLAAIFNEMVFLPMQSEELRDKSGVENIQIGFEQASLDFLDSTQLGKRDEEFVSNPEDQLVTEVLHAAEAAYGKIEALPEKIPLAEMSVQVGKSEGSFQASQGLVNRSGLLEVKSGKRTNWKEVTLGAIASSANFILNVEYAARKNHSGYLFKLELSPKPGVHFRRIAHNVFFLIDRSHSIRSQRFELTKKAVSYALNMLQDGDTFNILFFDDAISRLAPENLVWNPQNVALAKEYLANQRFGGIWAATDLYSSLDTIIPKAVGEHEVNTAILLSDGDTFLNLEKQRTHIGRWTRENAGKVALYSVAAGKGNNLALLDLLSFFNKGKLQYSDSIGGMGASLLHLMQAIRHPIGKNIKMTAIASNPNVVITLFPGRPFLPNLYENGSYVVYGVIDKLDDFHIFFQGKYYDKEFDIKQKVTFELAQHVDVLELEKQLAQQKAYESYYLFLRDGKQSYLTQARELLRPFQLPEAF